KYRKGMVVQVLSLRREDRRALIEEAADVRVYRHKLEDAQNKLKATRENMDRVRMLVREIEPRINQLERQAGRAVKYLDLSRELAATLHVWYAHQWRAINDHLLAAMTTLDQRVEEAERTKTDAKACEDGLAQLRAAIDERRAEINSRETRLRSMQDYVSDLERRTTLDTEREHMLSERIQEVDAELGQMRAEAEAQASLTVAVDTSELQTRLEAAQAALEEHRKRLSAAEQEMLSLQRSALLHEQSVARAKASEEELTRRISEQAETLVRLASEQDSTASDRRKQIVEMAAWAKEYATALAESRRTGAELERASRERTYEASALTSARRDEAAIEDELRTLRAEFESTQLKLEMIETLEVRPQAPDAGVRAVLEAGNILKTREVAPADLDLPGVLGLVGQVLRVPPGLERAIEAALAENLFSIICERQRDVTEALHLLLTHDLGRATMYALDNFHETRPLNLIKERGVLGVASQLVKCDGRYRKLIDTLLGRTVVVEDVELARRFVRRGLASAVATTSGVLLRPIGSIAAGSFASVQASFVHERELSDLPAEIERLRPLVEERQAAFDDTRRRAEQAAAHAERIDTDVERLRHERGRSDAALAGLRTRFTAVSARLVASRDALRHAVAEIARLTSGRGRIEVQRDARAQEAQAAAVREEEERRSVERIEAERRHLIEVVSEHAAIVAQMEGELRTERQPTEAHRVTRERIERQIATRLAQGAKLREEVEGTASRLAATQRELLEKSGEVEGLVQELEPARRELSQFVSRERSLSTELMDANGRMRDAERALYDAQNDVRTTREEVDSLKQNFEAEGFVVAADGEIERAPALETDSEAKPAEAYVENQGDLPTWMRSEDDLEDVPPMRGGSTINSTEVRDRIADLRAQIRALGPINEQAADDYADNRERFDFLSGQLTDLTSAEEQLQSAIGELDGIIRERFRATFKTVNQEFERYFSAFFRGGSARLELGEADEYGLPGIEIFAQPPGKKLGSLALLSGGERSLTAVALLFALLQANPSPICVLDEVDAALDEANVGRFVEELRMLAEKTQFIIITHNRRTIEIADAIYGVSMGGDSVSRILGLKLADVPHSAN
ncbi:MAG: chromosome segregation protein SMC, partial [Dehalococcoidia bacterium]